MRRLLPLLVGLLVLIGCGSAAATVTPAPPPTPTLTAVPATPTLSVSAYAATVRAVVQALAVAASDTLGACSSQTPTCQHAIATALDVYQAQVTQLGQIRPPAACVPLKDRADAFLLATHRLLNDAEYAYWHATSQNNFLAAFVGDGRPATTALDAFALERDTGACQ